MNFDELMMQRCLELAARGAGAVAPNPLVGAVVVYEGTIIGEGYHQEFGGPHAEINALNSIAEDKKNLIVDATLYVNLEPCNHFGKTPPCTERILSEKIKKVVIGSADPNPTVTGGGIQKLKEHSVEVVAGVHENECKWLNRFFYTFHEKQRPYITLKWAQSSDGFLAGKNYEPVHFTNSFADQLVHKWRAEHAAIMAGGKTIITDDPELTVRKWPGKNPVRITLNTGQDFDMALNILSGETETLIFNFYSDKTIGKTKYIKLEPDEDQLAQLIEHLCRVHINSLLVEGGARTIRSFVDHKLWDEAKIFVSTLQLNEGISAPSLPGRIRSTESFFDNLLITTSPE